MKPLLVGLCAALVLMAVGAYVWTHQHRALTDALRDAENARLALAGQIVQDQDSKQELQDTVRDLLAKNQDLRSAVEAAQKAAPSAKPIETYKLKTNTVPVQDAPRPPDPKPDTGTWEIKNAPAVCGKGCAYTETACALRPGDAVSFDVDQVVLKTDKGNRLVAGTAAVWREAPGPRAKLAQGTFTSALSDVDGLAPPSEPRWGAELDGLCSGAGCGLGASVLFPPVKLLGVRLEARAGFLLGPAPAALGALGARF